MNIIELKPKPNQSAIDYAKKLLTKCESGEVVEITSIEVSPDGTYCTSGTECKSSVIRTGRLFSAAIDSSNAARIS